MSATILTFQICILVYQTSDAQEDLLNRTRFPIWTFNTQNVDIYGLSVGYTTTQKIENVNTNGLRFELVGLAMFLPLIPQSPLADSDSAHQIIMSYPYTEKINGISISPLGTGCDCIVNGLNIYGVGSIIQKINGINVSWVMNFVEVQNGIEASFYWNEAYVLRGAQLSYIHNNAEGKAIGLQFSAFNTTAELVGAQIGIFNKTKKIKGIQIGLWNVNEKRKFPILNF